MRGACRSDPARASGYPGAVSRYVSPLRADLDVSRRDGRALRSELDQPARSGAPGRVVAGREHRRLLRAPQGGTALLVARTLRRLVYGAAPRSVAKPREFERSGALQAAERQLDSEDRAARRMDRARRVALRQGPRDPAAPPLRARLHQHRLRAMHGDPARSERSAVGPLAGPEARMRDPHPAVK